VDVRRGSATFGQWAGVELSADNHRQAWIPPGFAHGFLVLSDSADFLYKTTAYYAPEAERSVRWNDRNIGIRWPIPAGVQPLVSTKDDEAPLLATAELFELL
jgi:dTDP-4-dehydrorhamnose 3,5-epimerase